MTDNKTILFLVIAIFQCFTTFAQELPENAGTILQDIVESRLDELDETIEYQEFYDQLVYYAQNPLNINTATIEELHQLYILNTLQVNQLLKYRETYGTIYSIHELAFIEGFSVEDAKLLKPFLSFDKVDSREDFSMHPRYIRHEFILRTQWLVEQQKGFIRDSLDSRDFQGNKQKYYLRYRAKAGKNLRFGFTAEKDPGESFQWNSKTKGFDYLSGFAELRDMKWLDRLVVGDYHVKFGQGLILWPGFSFGKTSGVLNVCKHNQGIRGYGSTNENDFMRGLASTMKSGAFDLTTFMSSKKIDANITLRDSTGNIAEFSSLQTTGYHRTDGEIIDKNAVHEYLYGASAGFRNNWYTVHVNFSGIQYNADFKKDRKPYNIHDFRGSRNHNYSLSYKLSLNNMFLFGEAAMSQNAGKAIINGFIANIHPAVQASLVHRYFEPEFQTVRGSAFSEYSNTTNEKGLYTGISVQPFRWMDVKLYADIFEHPWLRYNINSPGNGREFMILTDCYLSENTSLQLRYKVENKQYNVSGDEGYIKYPEYRQNRSLRIHFQYQPAKQLGLKNRIEFSKSVHGNEQDKGYMMYQDIKYSFDALPVVIYARYALFDTDSWSTRIYAYEHDVLYGFSVPPYYSKGNRYYLMMKWKLTDNVGIWARYSKTVYSDKEEIGSGLHMIEGNTRTEFKIQVRIKF